MKKILRTVVTSFAVMFMLAFGGITANAQTVNESEPNDTMETAETILANHETAAGCVDVSHTGQYVVKGVTSANDPDWYRVYLDAGDQYVTCNGSAFNFYLYDSDENCFKAMTYSKPGLGASAYKFEVKVAGYYYVKVTGLSDSPVSYILAVGGPTYTVDHCTKTMDSISFEGYDETRELQVESASMPEDAIVYTIYISGVLSTATDGVKMVASTNGTTINMLASNLTKTGLVNLNIPLDELWYVTFKYRKNVTITPKVTFSYVYPVTTP